MHRDTLGGVVRKGELSALTLVEGCKGAQASRIFVAPAMDGYAVDGLRGIERASLPSNVREYGGIER